MRHGLSLTMAVFIGALFSTAPAQAQSELCRDPGGFCRQPLSADCLQRLGAGVLEVETSGEIDDSATASVDGDCARQRDNYVSCLAEAAETCGAGPATDRPGTTAGGCGPADARQLWPDLRESEVIEDLESFAELCQGTPQAQLAASRARRLRDRDASADAADTDDREIPYAPPPSRTDASAAQRELKRLGFYDGEIDGIWGIGSETAMKRFQRAQRISPLNGWPNAATLAALKSAPTPKPDSTTPTEAEKDAAARAEQTSGARISRQLRSLGPDVVAAASRPDRGAALLQLGDDYLNGANGKPSDVKASLLLFRASCMRGNARGCQVAGILSEKLGEPENAPEWYSRALKLDPGDAASANRLKALGQ